MELGGILVNHLIETEVVTKSTDKNPSGHEIPCIIMIKEFQEAFIMSSSWIKPSLLLEEPRIKAKYQVVSNINIKAKLNRPRISRERAVNVNPKQLLHKVLNHDGKNA